MDQETLIALRAGFEEQFEHWRIDAAGHQHLLAAVQDFYVADAPGAEAEYDKHHRTFDTLRRSLGLVEPLEDA